MVKLYSQGIIYEINLSKFDINAVINESLLTYKFSLETQFKLAFPLELQFTILILLCKIFSN